MKKIWCMGLVFILLTGLAISAVLNLVLFRQAIGSYKERQQLQLDPTKTGLFARNLKSLSDAPDGQKRVVFFGDSRIEMWAGLEDHQDFQAVNRGAGGETTAQALLRLDREVLDLNPNMVVIQLGINDLKSIGLFPDRGDDIIQECKRNLQEIVRRLESAECTVVLLSIFPVGDVPLSRRPVWSDRTLTAVTELNQWLGSLSGEAVFYVDCDDVLGEGGRMKSAYALDDLHLNRAGYDSLANFVTPQLRLLLDEHLRGSDDIQ